MVRARKTTVLVRLRLADRPGALASVMSRIGAVAGDLVAIDILERRGGWVTDELVIELPSTAAIELVRRELAEVDGVTIEAVQPLVDDPYDPQLSASDVASVIAGADDVDELFASLTTHARRAVRAERASVIDDQGAILAASGAVPYADQPLERRVSMPLAGARASLVLDRSVPPFRAMERRQAAALARIADSLHAKLREKARLRSLLVHPSSGLPASSPLLSGR